MKPDTTTPEWLANLALGEKCAIRASHFYGVPYDILTVEKITATQFVLRPENGGIRKRVRRSDGKVQGHSYTYIEPITTKVLKANDEKGLRLWVQSLDRTSKELSIDQLRRMKAIADEAH